MGNKDDETYLRTIIHRFRFYDYIYIKTIPYEDKLAKVEEYFQMLIWAGIDKKYERQIIKEKSRKDPNGTIDIWIFRWDLHPRIVGYKQLLKENGLL